MCPGKLVSWTNYASQIQLKWYQCIPQCKSCSSKGGLIIYLSNTFEYTCKLKLTKYKTYKGQVIHVNEKDVLKPINFGDIYRPPKDILENYNEFINEFSLILNTLESNNTDASIAMVFNIDLLKINEKHVFGDYLDIVSILNVIFQQGYQINMGLLLITSFVS